MAQDSQGSHAIWQEMMANWQSNQQSLTEKMLEGWQQWNSAFTTTTDIPKTNPILDTYQTIAESFFKNYVPLGQVGLGNDWEKFLQSMPAHQEMIAEINKLMESGQQLFEKMAAGLQASIETDEAQNYLLQALKDMSNPNTWLKYSGDNFDLSAHKLSEGPLFSGISDIDNRLAQVSDSWRELFDRSKEYHAIVFSRWTQTYSQFLDRLKGLSEEQRAQLSPRKLIDIWSNIANEELLTLHRSDEFLSAQRAVIRASMQYRVHEKNIAKVICEALHIPTREEVDDLHKTVTELRRELRQTKASLQQLQQSCAQKPAKTARSVAKKVTKKEKQA